jgi:hypothetical protein
VGAGEKDEEDMDKVEEIEIVSGYGWDCPGPGVDEDVNDVVVVNVETIVESSEVNVVVIVAVAMPVLDPVKVEIAESVETLPSDAWDVVERL